MCSGLTFYLTYDRESVNGESRILARSVMIRHGQVLDSVADRAFAVTPQRVYFLSQGHLQYYDFAAATTKMILTVEKANPNALLSVTPDEHWLLSTQVDQGGSDLMRVDNFR